jgi:molybdate transport system ATP-binding protein
LLLLITLRLNQHCLHRNKSLTQSGTFIEFTHITAAYQTTPVLRDINWQWESGQQWAIIGGNSAGKTTIAHLLTDQLRPQAGQLMRHRKLAEGRDIAHVSFDLQRQLMDHDKRFDDSEVREDAFDIGTTVRQAVLQNQAENSEFNALARQCGISHILDRGIRFISTGESRKTLLARALYQGPALLIVDNPFEGMDRQSQLDFRQLIDQLLASDLPTLLLLQQLEDLPDQVDHILWLEQGHVMACGQRHAVLEKLHQQSAPQQQAVTLPPALARGYEVNSELPLLSLNGVNVSYGDKKILHDINWTMQYGQHCCISGPNVAGKSTLLSLLCGDNQKAYGQDISLFGQRRGSGESIWDIKQKFGVVSTAIQLNHIQRMGVAEVVASGLYDSVGLYQQCSGKERAIALQWLKLIGLQDIARQNFKQLSFGQQRLALLARAMVKSPLILILDEPCIGLDNEHRQKILLLVDQIAKRGDCHILYVSHSAGEMPNCIDQQLILTPHPLGGYTAEVLTQTSPGTIARRRV